MEGSSKAVKGRRKVHLRKRQQHPCDTAQNNTVIHTADYDIVCTLPTGRALKHQLESNAGGYNRHYIASSLFKAKKHFTNMFTRYGMEYKNTTQWKDWSAVDSSSVQVLSTSIGVLQVAARDVKGNRYKKETPYEIIQCLPVGSLTANGNSVNYSE